VLEKEQDVTFFEKKVTKKTFALAGRGNAVATGRKSTGLFAARRPGSFSSEKEVLPCFD
jgi:hypothetical protein